MSFVKIEGVSVDIRPGESGYSALASCRVHQRRLMVLVFSGVGMHFCPSCTSALEMLYVWRPMVKRGAQMAILG